MSTTKPRRLTDIAAAINMHLKRIEASPVENAANERGHKPYYAAGAYAAGSRVSVKYIAFQGGYSLTRPEAEAYLAWLDAGNVGTHHKQRREAPATDAAADDREVTLYRAILSLSGPELVETRAIRRASTYKTLSGSTRIIHHEDADETPEAAVLRLQCDIGGRIDRLRAEAERIPRKIAELERDIEQAGALLTKEKP